jgi:hypothetical protein
MQVRDARFFFEILDGISSSIYVRYRTACHGRCGVFWLRSDTQRRVPASRIILRRNFAPCEEVSSRATWSYRP